MGTDGKRESKESVQSTHFADDEDLNSMTQHQV